MSSMKARAREAGSGKFTAGSSGAADGPPKRRRGHPKVAAEENTQEEAHASKRPIGLPKASKPKKEPPMTTFEVSITVSMGGADVDRSSISNAQKFLAGKTLAGKCSIERGGSAYHLHLQMVARLQAKSLIYISRLLKTYLGWDANQRAGGMVMCKKLTNKCLHTFHGLLGYCMKDASKDHFETVDRNVTAEDINIGLEQYALRGQVEKKNGLVLTMQNLVECVIMWRQFNCKHPLIVDFDRDIYEMLKTGKYYPAASWVIGGYGRGYEPYRMQSLYKMMVRPHEITREDVANVFEALNTCGQQNVPRKQWFNDRWKDQPSSDATGSKAKRVLFSDADGSHDRNEGKKTKIANLEMAKILAFTPKTPDLKLDALCDAALETPSKENNESTRKRGRKSSPTRNLWPEEWNMETQFSSGSSSDESSDSEDKPGLPPSMFIPLYTRTNPALVVS